MTESIALLFIAVAAIQSVIQLLQWRELYRLRTGEEPNIALIHILATFRRRKAKQNARKL